MRDRTNLQWNVPSPGDQIVKMLLRFLGQGGERHRVHADFFFDAVLVADLVPADFLLDEDLVATLVTEVDLALLDGAATTFLAGGNNRLTDTEENPSGVTFPLA